MEEKKKSLELHRLSDTKIEIFNVYLYNIRLSFSVVYFFFFLISKPRDQRNSK